MAVARPQGQAIDLLQLEDLSERCLPKWRLAFEGMQHDTFEQIPERDVLELRKGFQHLEQPFFHPNAGLYSFDFYHECLRFNHGNYVPWYRRNVKTSSWA